jgi:hypothetical protein
MATRPDHQGKNDRCPSCCGGGLVPAPGCTCDGDAHTCTPLICSVCDGTGTMMTEGRARYVSDGTVRQGQPRFTTVSRPSRWPAYPLLPAGHTTAF